MFKILLLILLPVFLFGDIKYTPFIDKQIKLTQELNCNDIDDKKVDEIINEIDSSF